MRESALGYKYGHFTRPEPQSTLHTHWTLIHWGAMKGLIIFFLACGCSTMQIKSVSSASDECSLTPVIHVLQFPGCVPKPIPSFACIGKCGSYVQVSGLGPVFFRKSGTNRIFFWILQLKVSGSKIWQMERSCNCCQESGEREASVSLFCPKAKQGERKFRKVRVLFSIFFCIRRSFSDTYPGNGEDL